MIDNENIETKYCIMFRNLCISIEVNLKKAKVKGCHKTKIVFIQNFLFYNLKISNGIFIVPKSKSIKLINIVAGRSGNQNRKMCKNKYHGK